MPSPANADALLVTGVYGAGKSTVVADIGALLGDRGERYGLLDVDWLGWFDSGISHQAHRRAVLGNLATMSSGFVIAGVRRLALAWSIRDQAQLDEVRLAVLEQTAHDGWDLEPVGDGADEGPVDLQDVDGELPQVAQRGVAVPKSSPVPGWLARYRSQRGPQRCH